MGRFSFNKIITFSTRKVWKAKQNSMKNFIKSAMGWSLKGLPIILLVSILMSGIQTQAQTTTLMPLVAGDTMTNAGTVTKVLGFTAGYGGVAIQPVLTKFSGTVAGTIILSESLDGVNYKNTDTLTLANQTTNTVVWKKCAPIPRYYKLTASGGTTVSAVMRTYYLPRKYDK